MKPETAKPATAATVNGLRNFEQLAGQLNSTISEPTTPTQGLPAKLQIILILRRLTELAVTGLPR
jgi:hypothetical protein